MLENRKRLRSNLFHSLKKGGGGGRGYFLVIGYWGCTAGCCSIFTTGLTMPFQAFSIELLKWGRNFSRL